MVLNPRTVLRFIAILSITCAVTLVPQSAVADDDPCAPNYDCGCEFFYCVSYATQRCSGNLDYVNYSCDANTVNCSYACLIG